MTRPRAASGGACLVRSASCWPRRAPPRGLRGAPGQGASWPRRRAHHRPKSCCERAVGARPVRAREADRAPRRVDLRARGLCPHQAPGRAPRARRSSTRLRSPRGVGGERIAGGRAQIAGRQGRISPPGWLDLPAARAAGRDARRSECQPLPRAEDAAKISQDRRLRGAVRPEAAPGLRSEPGLPPADEPSRSRDR